MASAISTVELADDRAKGSRERRRLKTPAPLAFLDLAAISLLRDVLPVDEPVVRRCMNPYEAGPSNNGDHPGKHFVEFLRTATIFLLDDRETRAALNSRPPDGVALPRLPYRRVWLEWHDVSDVGRMGAPVPLVADEQLQEGHRHVYELLGIGLSELDPGTAWDVFWPIKEIASFRSDRKLRTTCGSGA